MVRLLLTESIVLSIAGSVAGLVFALWSADFLVAFTSEQVPRLRTLQIDGAVFLFTLAIAIASGLLFGLAPSLQARRTDLNQTLKDTGGGKSSSRHALGDVFIVSEVALAAMLLVGSGLLIQTFIRLQQVEMGFNADNLVALELTLPSSKYPPERRTDFYENALERIRANGTIRSAALSTGIPLGDSMTSGGFSIENRELPVRGQLRSATRINVSSGYMQTMEISVLRGRDFTSADREGSVPVAIVNEEVGRRYFPGQDPIGHRLKFGRPTTDAPWFTIVGISRNVRGFTIQQSVQPEIYVPHSFGRPSGAYIVVRSDSEAEVTAGLLRSLIAEIDPNLPVETTTMDALITRSMAQPRLQMLLLTVLPCLRWGWPQLEFTASCRTS